MSTNQNQPTRNLVPGIVLVTLGILFLIGQIGGLGWLFSMAWPLLIVGPGLIFFAAAYFGGRREAGLFFPGTIITGIGGILAYQNITGNWESWAYAWALIPVFVGIALMLSGRRTGSEGEMRTGRSMVTWAGISFIGMAAFFEMFVFGGAFLGVGRFLLPAVLILAGVYLFFNGRMPQLGSSTAANRTSLRDEVEKAKVEALSTPEPKHKRDEERLINLNGETMRVPAGENLRRRIDNVIDDDADQPVNGNENNGTGA